VAVIKKHTAFASDKNAAKTQIASHGVASFYTEGTRTASGERFDTHELTAAHPALPFGTRLRVTNFSTGRSVTVRVNDRGPFVPGRVVDVSYSAAETLYSRPWWFGRTKEGPAHNSLVEMGATASEWARDMGRPHLAHPIPDGRDLRLASVP
jgi:rare lipoprotein A